MARIRFTTSISVKAQHNWDLYLIYDYEAAVRRRHEIVILPCLGHNVGLCMFADIFFYDATAISQTIIV